MTITERKLVGEGGNIVYFTVVWFLSTSPVLLPPVPCGAYL
jgi:hypothetical protein